MEVKPVLRRDQTDASIIEESLRRPAFSALFDRHFELTPANLAAVRDGLRRAAALPAGPP